MKLELKTNSLEVVFECADEDADHVIILDKIRGLIEELDFHQDVKLSIVSIPVDESDDLDSEELPDADPLE